MICQVYRSRAKPDVYLYVNMQHGLERVPEALLSQLGGIGKAMTLVLKPGRKLARITADELMRAIEQTGYYLQLPALPDTTFVIASEPAC